MSEGIAAAEVDVAAPDDAVDAKTPAEAVATTAAELAPVTPKLAVANAPPEVCDVPAPVASLAAPFPIADSAPDPVAFPADEAPKEAPLVLPSPKLGALAEPDALAAEAGAPDKNPVGALLEVPPGASTPSALVLALFSPADATPVEAGTPDSPGPDAALAVEGAARPNDTDCTDPLDDAATAAAALKPPGTTAAPAFAPAAIEALFAEGKDNENAAAVGFLPCDCARVEFENAGAGADFAEAILAPRREPTNDAAVVGVANDDT